VGYVDLRKRRGKHARGTREPAGVWWDAMHNPYFSMALGFVVALITLWLIGRSTYHPWNWHPFESAIPWMAIPTILVCRGVWQLGHWRPQDVQRKPGSEKQLLMIIADTGGITPVEAALETSLTVDEAEEVLSRLADRGHLLVESRDGVLSYALPGRRSDIL
jgi:hypothetical protein